MTIERRAILRIDAQPTGKKFQGVWLELVDGTKWVIDYRARGLWMWFRDREVTVSGDTYKPEGQAISATHFRVEHLRDARPARGTRPYLGIGPERLMRGQLVTEVAPARSKLTDRMVLRGEDGITYGVVADEELPPREMTRVRARVLEPDLSYAARADGPDVWIVALDVSDDET